MQRLLSLGLALGLGSVMAACGSSGVSCKVEAADACFSFTASTYTDASCTAQGGVVVDACSTDGDVGTCSTEVAGETTSTTYYGPTYDDATAAESAETTCTDGGGTWTPAS